MPDDKPQPPVPAPAGATLPARLDRAALERVLARAAELQSATGEPAEGLTEAQILDVGAEVGLSGEHLRQALAEERTRIAMPEEDGLEARLLGPAHASASRTVRGTPAQVLAAIDAWMQKDECLQVKRTFADRMMWEPRRDLVGNIKVGLNLGGRGYALTRATDVAATVFAVDAERVLVRLDADLSEARTRRLRGGAAAATIGTLGGAGWIMLVSLLAQDVTLAGFLLAGIGVGSLPAVAGVAGAASIFRSHAKAVARAQLALEQILDRLEGGAADARRTLPPVAGLLEVLNSVRSRR